MLAKLAFLSSSLIVMSMRAMATPGRDFATFVGSDFQKQGVLAADALIESLGGPSTKATIVELTGTTGSSPAILRGGGFDGELASKAPDIKIVAEQTANFDRATGQQVMATLIKQYPNIKGVFAHNDEMAIGAITALKAAGKHPGQDIKVVSIDGTKDAINLVLSGEEYAVVQSNPRLGQLVFQTLDNISKAKTSRPGSSSRIKSLRKLMVRRRPTFPTHSNSLVTAHLPVSYTGDASWSHEGVAIMV